jgi:hypothetical protein
MKAPVLRGIIYSGISKFESENAFKDLESYETYGISADYSVLIFCVLSIFGRHFLVVGAHNKVESFMVR